LLGCNLLDLLGLLVDDGRGFGKVGIDEFLVGLVDQWGEEENGSSNKREAPERNNLNEIVGEESSDECLGTCQVESISKNCRVLTAPDTNKFSAKTIC